METKFSFTKPQLESLTELAQGERVIYHDMHKNAYGLQLRSTSTSKHSLFKNASMASLSVSPLADSPTFLLKTPAKKQQD